MLLTICIHQSSYKINVLENVFYLKRSEDIVNAFMHKQAKFKQADWKYNKHYIKNVMWKF